jgi:hypothetical protein
MRSTRTTLILLLGAALLFGACGSNGGDSNATAGKSPSEQARMICQSEAREDIASALGVKPVKVSAPTWSDHLYSCKYMYSNGAIPLSVKELDGTAATTRYFESLAQTLGRVDAIGLGQGAFSTTNHSVVVRKDNKVLTVDPSQLPGEFGAPPQSPSTVALTVATTIMGCWTGE